MTSSVGHSAAWEEPFVVVSMMLGLTADETRSALGPEERGRTERTLRALSSPDRMQRAQVQADMLRTLASCLDAMEQL